MTAEFSSATPLLDQARALFAKASDYGLGELDVAALVQVLSAEKRVAPDHMRDSEPATACLAD